MCAALFLFLLLLILLCKPLVLLCRLRSALVDLERLLVRLGLRLLLPGLFLQLLEPGQRLRHARLLPFVHGRLLLLRHLTQRVLHGLLRHLAAIVHGLLQFLGQLVRLRALFLRHAIVDDVLHFARLDDRSGRLRDVCLQNHAVHARICPGHGKAGQAAREERKAVFFCEVSDHRRQRLRRRPALCDIICVGRHDLAPVMLRHHVIRTV